jgi:hypothetical protein
MVISLSFFRIPSRIWGDKGRAIRRHMSTQERIRKERATHMAPEVTLH